MGFGRELPARAEVARARGNGTEVEGAVPSILSAARVASSAAPVAGFRGSGGFPPAASVVRLRSRRLDAVVVGLQVVAEPGRDVLALDRVLRGLLLGEVHVLGVELDLLPSLATFVCENELFPLVARMVIFSWFLVASIL